MTKHARDLIRRKSSTALTQYDPIKGVLKIHAAREGIKFAKRARDREALDAAIESKLRWQQEFVNWWDNEAARRHEQRQAGPGRGRKIKLGPQNMTEFLKPEDFGLTVQLLSNWRIRLSDPTAFAKTLAAEQEHARRRLEFDIREVRPLQEPIALPHGVFRVFYADPPWNYGNSGVINDSDGYGRAARHYPSMTIDELCAMDVIAHVASDAVLFLWVTSPLLAECWPVIDAWGFTYKTSMVWDKVAHNYGSYVSVRHELLLICTRGSCTPDHPVPMPDSVVTVDRSAEHSEKPEIFRTIIDRLYDGDETQKLELFARAPVTGWTAYGNELVTV